MIDYKYRGRQLLRQIIRLEVLDEDILEVIQSLPDFENLEDIRFNLILDNDQDFMLLVMLELLDNGTREVHADGMKMLVHILRVLFNRTYNDNTIDYIKSISERDLLFGAIYQIHELLCDITVSLYHHNFNNNILIKILIDTKLLSSELQGTKLIDEIMNSMEYSDAFISIEDYHAGYGDYSEVLLSELSHEINLIYEEDYECLEEESYDGILYELGVREEE